MELPQPIPGTHRANELDKSLLSYRKTELTKLKQAASRLRESATDVDEAVAELQVGTAERPGSSAVIN